MKTNKRTQKNNKKPISAENQTVILLEAIHDDVKIITERHSVLNKKIDDNHKELNEKLDAFKQEMIEFKNDTKSSFQTIFRHLSDIDDELKSIKSEITGLKATLDRKADKEKLLDLERRVTLLEKELAALR